MLIQIQFFGGRGSGGASKAGGGGGATAKAGGAQAKPAEKGSNLTQGQTMRNMSYSEAENLYRDAPVGTKIQMTNHNEGDYVGEYTKTSNTTWEGSQQYRTSYGPPKNVSTAKGFAMRVVGNDVKVLKKGRR